MKKIFFLILFFPLTALCGYEWNYEYGLRQDQIKTSTYSESSPGVFSNSSDLKIDDISAIEIGFSSNSNCKNGIYWRAAFRYGYILDKGNYREMLTNSENNLFDTQAVVFGGYTIKSTLGIGYLHPVSTRLSVGPLLGYSLDKIETKMTQTTTNGHIDLNLFEFYNTNRFKGPWIGLEGYYHQPRWNIRFGYEYHHSDWYSNWLVKGGFIENESFSEERKAIHSNGHTFFLKSSYHISTCDSIGAGFQYQIWKLNDGVANPLHGTFEDFGFPATQREIIPYASWKSVQFNIHYIRRF